MTFFAQPVVKLPSTVIAQAQPPTQAVPGGGLLPLLIFVCIVVVIAFGIRMSARNTSSPSTRSQSASVPPPSTVNAQKVSVIDVNIPFWRMVALMVKSAFAAIPAIIIICAVILIVFFVIGMLFGGVAALFQALQPHH